MHRDGLLKLLGDYRKTYPEEMVTIDQFTDFVRSNRDCFERSLDVGHVTGSAWLINRDGSQTLLTHHRKLNKWLQLGGHADGYSDVLDVALREAQEESGIVDLQPVTKDIFDLDVHLIPKRKDEPAHYHYDVRFALQVTGSENFVVSEESHSLSWVSVQNLEDKTQEESMLRMGRKWLKA